MIQKLARFVRGQTPSMLDTTKANQVVDAINSMQNIKVVEGEETRAFVGREGIILQVRMPDLEGLATKEEVDATKLELEGEEPIEIEDDEENQNKKIIKIKELKGNSPIKVDEKDDKVEFSIKPLIGIDPIIVTEGANSVEFSMPEMVARYPLKITRSNDQIVFALDGFTRKIKYCGGEGHFLMLPDEYYG